MSYLFWRGLAAMNGDAGLAAEWRLCLGEAYPLLAPFLVPSGERAQTYPCVARPACGCRHVVRETRAGLQAVCTCGDCRNLPLAPADLGLLEIDRTRLGAALARALALAPPMPGIAATVGERCWQIGRLPNYPIPVWFGAPVLEDLERIFQPGPAVLLVPAPGPDWRACRAFLAGQGAAGLELLTLVTALPGAMFRAERSLEQFLEPWLASLRDRNDSALREVRNALRELRRELVPARVPEPIEENEARRLFALLQELESGAGERKAPLVQVFRLYCLEGLSAAQVARRCRCSKTLVISRLAALQRKLGRDPAALRPVSGHYEGVEEALNEPWARHLHRRVAAGLEAPAG